jgi:hypothetical protein
VRQNIGKSRLHQHQFLKAHHPHGPRRGAYIARMAGIHEDKACGLHVNAAGPTQ